MWAYCQKHIAAGYKWQSFVPYKLLELWNILHVIKPRCIVEHGSGCSTAVFAEYCRQSEGRVHFTTMDESHSWQSLVRLYLGEAGNEINWCVRAAIRDGDTFRYFGAAPSACDFLYVDGPANTIDDHQEGACLDCISYAGNNQELRTIVFDIRRASVAAFKRNYVSEEFTFDNSAWAESDVPFYLSAVRHHTIARRHA